MASGMRKILLLRYGWGLLGLCRTRAGKEEDDEEDAEEEWHLSLEWLWCIVGLGVGEWGNHDRPCMCLPKPANLLKPRLFRSTRRPPYKKPLMPFGSFSSYVTAMGFIFYTITFGSWPTWCPFSLPNLTLICLIKLNNITLKTKLVLGLVALRPNSDQIDQFSD